MPASGIDPEDVCGMCPIYEAADGEFRDPKPELIRTHQNQDDSVGRARSGGVTRLFVKETRSEHRALERIGYRVSQCGHRSRL